MPFPVAVVGDMHTCPMQTPGTPPVPHVGGPLLPPGQPMVLAMNRPVAVVGGMATCVGPPDALVPGKGATVLVGGQPVAVVTDVTAHGGVITGPGAATVLIGP